jgi:glycosyltransferase involved in cell wall biosynthesis
VKGEPADEISPFLPYPASLPGVFLMTNSLETGGSERQFIALANSLDPRKFRRLTACIMRKGPMAKMFPHIPEFRLGGSLYGWRSILTRVRLARYLRHHRVDVAHAFDFYTNLTMIPAARLAGVPVVIGSQRQLGDLLTSSQFRVQADAFRMCDAIVCNSKAAAARLADAGIRERNLFVIGNGLAPELFAPAEPLLPRRPGIIRIGMIARMNTRAKRHSLFLQAAARVRQKYNHVEFVLAGDGPLRVDLEQEVSQLGMSEWVHFLGDCRNIPALLASLDLTVLPSQSESLSNSILESMAAAVPVIATRVGGNPELVNDGRGLLVPPDNAPALAWALERLVNDSQYRALCAANSKYFARENFTLERMRQSHEDLYQELLERKRWRPRSTVAAESGAPRKRIRLVAASLRYVGGQSVQADLLLRNWKDDVEIDARLIPIDPLFPSPLRWIEKVPGLRTVVREPLYLLSLWRGLKDANVAHVFSASYWSFLIAPVPAWLIARLRGAKTVIHYHSGEAPDHLRKSRAARRVLSRVDRVVVPSRYLVEVFREFNLHADAVANVVDLSQVHFRERNPLRPHLVCTRGFHPYYCVDLVVRAFAQVVREFPDARLDLVGKGPSEQQIRSVVRELNVPGVHFMGVANRGEIGAVYDRADIFINASRLDNMPVSVMEAFAAGTPVVTTSPECMSYLVEDGRTGLLSPVGDADALASNVIRLLRDQELAHTIARNAYEKSRTFHWEHVRNDWLKVYRSLEDNGFACQADDTQTGIVGVEKGRL